MPLTVIAKDTRSLAKPKPFPVLPSVLQTSRKAHNHQHMVKATDNPIKNSRIIDKK